MHLNQMAMLNQYEYSHEEAPTAMLASSTKNVKQQLEKLEHGSITPTIPQIRKRTNLNLDKSQK